jgi:hypothetical protein
MLEGPRKVRVELAITDEVLVGSAARGAVGTSEVPKIVDGPENESKSVAEVNVTEPERSGDVVEVAIVWLRATKTKQRVEPAQYS